MSRQIALDTIWLRPTPRLAHTEYSLEYHRDLMARQTGLDPNQPGTVAKFYDLWDMDFIFVTHDGLYGDWENRGRCTNMGHAEYAADGSDMHAPAACPFNEPEEVWAFDAVAEYGLPSRNDQIAAYEAFLNDLRRAYPGQLVPGGYYRTIVSGAIAAFGWDMLLLAAADARRMEKVFDSFFRRTLFHMECWAETSAEVIIQHDDFVWTAGPFMHPDVYRQVIIPRYAELWKPLHAAGKKVLFCSDGNYMQFAEDIVAAGADGLIFEPCNEFEFMVERFGSSTVLVGSAVDCRDMTLGKWDEVRRSMDRSFELARRCRGLMWAVGNHVPANISDEMMLRYLEYLRAHWAR